MALLSHTGPLKTIVTTPSLSGTDLRFCLLWPVCVCVCDICDVVKYWVWKQTAGHYQWMHSVVNIKATLSIAWSPLCLLVLSSHSAQKHNLYLNNLFCSLSPNKGSKLEVEAWLWTSVCLTWCPFLPSLKICVSSSLSLSRGEWSSWSCGSCLKSFSPSARSDWQPRSAGPSLARIPRLWVPAAGSHPGLIPQWKASMPSGRIWQSSLIPGMSKVLSQWVNEPPPTLAPCCPSQCDKQVCVYVCSLILFCYLLLPTLCFQFCIFVVLFRYKKKVPDRFQWNLGKSWRRTCLLICGHLYSTLKLSVSAQ